MGNIYDKTKDKMKLLAVSIVKNDDPKDLAKYIEDQDIEYTVLIDNDGAVQEAYEIKYTPTYVIVDKKGVVSYVGALPPEDIEEYYR